MAALLGGGKNVKNSLGIVVDWFFKCKNVRCAGKISPFQQQQQQQEAMK
jgi:hypothetical protein